MRELLKCCGFGPAETELQLPRIERAFNKLGITSGDIERGKQRLNKYYDINLSGIRKILRLCLLDVVAAVLAREEGKKKIIFGFMAPGFNIFSSALSSISQEVYATHLCERFQLVLGSIFDKMGPVLEAAENRWLKAGTAAHCGNVKSLVGLFSLDLIPKPDLLVTSGYLCETAPKTIDLLYELDHIPKACLDTCNDREFKEYPEATKRLTQLTAKWLRRISGKIRDIAGIEITDEMLRDLIEAKKNVGRALGKLDRLIKNSDPLVIHANHQMLYGCLDSLPLSINDIPNAVDAVNTLYEELQDRVDKGAGVVKKGAPRILATLPSHFTDPRLDHLVAELGMALVATDNFFSSPDEEIPEDPYEQISLAHLQRSFPCGLKKRVQITVNGCKETNIDGVLDRIHVGCRSVAGDAIILKEAITNEMGVPVVLLERDDFDPRVYNHQQYKYILDVLKNMIVERSK